MRNNLGNDDRRAASKSQSRGRYANRQVNANNLGNENSLAIASNHGIASRNLTATQKTSARLQRIAIKPSVANAEVGADAAEGAAVEGGGVEAKVVNKDRRAVALPKAASKDRTVAGRARVNERADAKDRNAGPIQIVGAGASKAAIAVPNDNVIANKNVMRRENAMTENAMTETAILETAILETATLE